MLFLLAAHVRPGRGRHEVDHQQPRRAHRRQRDPRHAQVEQLARPRRAGRQQVDRRDHRDHEERLQHLGVERQADRDRAPHQRHQPSRPDRVRGRPQRQRQQQGQQHVRVVVPGHHHRDRRHRQRQSRQRPGGGAETAAHHVLHHPHRGHPGDGLGQQQAPGVEPEDPRGQRLHPQGQRWFVDRDERSRVHRAVEERLPAPRHPQHRGRVVGVGPLVDRQRPGVEERGERQYRPAGGTRPSRFPGAGERWSSGHADSSPERTFPATSLAAAPGRTV
ncbi:hypothetical protein SAMN05660874_00550 [Saccharopolyspora flava]|uniref:Uncharacterized protein n=1 Tax=Saccharopolyspora flava TaxID=95161 RepID=A0A1I6P8P9_9PSEU|nr:hypothetical protein SAMN05660874_00550 [Saccharopolyspora flava]